jgi:hypothetical protein
LSQLSELLHVKRARGIEIEDAIIQQIQNLLGSHERLQLQVKEFELSATTSGMSFTQPNHNQPKTKQMSMRVSQPNRNQPKTKQVKTPKSLRTLLQKAVLSTMKRNKAVKMFQISPSLLVSTKEEKIEKQKYEKAASDYMNSHDLIVTANTPFYDIVKTLPRRLTSGLSNDRKIARLISNIYADKIVSIDVRRNYHKKKSIF